jgi:hypothetical protein
LRERRRSARGAIFESVSSDCKDLRRHFRFRFPTPPP